MNKIIRYEWHSGFTVAIRKEVTEEEYLQNFEDSLFSSDKGFNQYARENQ